MSQPSGNQHAFVGPKSKGPELFDVSTALHLSPWLERVSWIALPPEQQIPLLAGARVHLLFVMSGALNWHGSASTTPITEGACWGPVTHPAHVTSGKEGVSGWLVKVAGGVSSALIGIPADAIRDIAVPLHMLWPQFRAREFSTRQASLAWVSSLLSDALSRFEQQQLWSPQHCRYIMQLLDQRPIASVASTLGLSPSTLERRLRNSFGLPPKTVARIQRLYRGIALLGNLPDAELANDIGFFDQSHFIADFRQLCGMTPANFRQHVQSQSLLGNLYR